MSGKAGTIAALALMMAVLAAFFFVPVRRTVFNEYAGPDGSLQRVRAFENSNITFEKYLRTRGTRPGGSAGSETTTSLQAGSYALRIGGILLTGGALAGISTLASGKNKRWRKGKENKKY
jgi:hypothetical protein